MPFKILFLGIGLLLFSCKNSNTIEVPEKLLDEDTYIAVFVDLHVFNAMVQAVDTVMNEDSLRTALFDHYNVTESNFQTTHAYYQSQPRLHQARLDSAINQLARDLEEMNKPKTLTPILQSGNNPDSLQSE